MPSDNIKRLVAQKVSITDVLRGEYIKEDGWNPNYIAAQDGKKISRVNIMAVVLSKSGQEGTNYSSLTLDDGTGNISVRSFEKNKKIDSLEIGDMVLLVGKLREYSRERYIIPEIIKKIENKDWVEVRKLELQKPKAVAGEVKKQQPVVKEEAIIESSSQMIYELIKRLDDGNGADFDNVVKNSKAGNTEKIISDLLQEGDVFELKPGKLKVLE